MTKEQFLVETIEYYSVNPVQRRCVSSKNHFSDYCTFSPITANKPNSEGCAIGRKVDPKFALVLDKERISLDDMINYHSEYIPEWIIEMGSDFLGQIMGLHDGRENWNETGLTEKGKQYVNGIVREYELNLPIYKINLASN